MKIKSGHSFLLLTISSVVILSALLRHSPKRLSHDCFPLLITNDQEQNPHCERLLSKTNKFVLFSYGCGTGCRVLNEQLGPPVIIENDWIRVPVYAEIWQNNYDSNTKNWIWQNEGVRGGVANFNHYWNAQCESGYFAESDSGELHKDSIQSVYIERGEFIGQLKVHSVNASIFTRWQKLCSFKKWSS